MLTGKTALVTGGTRGIGRAIALELAGRGARLLLTYHGNEDAASETLRLLEERGAEVLLLRGAAADPSHAAEAAALAKERYGGMDILVNNAGITSDKLLLRMDAGDFDRVLKTNLNGAFYMMKAFAPIMTKRRQGRIINISSLAGVRGNPGQSNYASSKAGLIGLTLSAAKELGSRGITVNAVAPGYILTDMTDVLTEGQKNAMLGLISLGRAGNPEDVAKAVAFLASEDAAYITGQVLGVDGGMMA